MDISYKNDANHNYMIIRKVKGQVNVNHEKMVIRNNINGLLKMNLHFIDDDAFYYYDIRSKQSLSRLFEGRYMTGEEMESFFRGMIRAFNELEQYLLPAEGLILDPEYIYVDIDTVTPEFAFCPSGRTNGKAEEIQSLAEFLIDHADRNDPLAGRLSYDYYESITDGIISPAALLSGLSENSPAKEPALPGTEKEPDFDYWETEEDMSELDYFLKKEPDEEKDRGILKIALICLGLIASAAILYLILVLNPSLIPFIQLNEREYMTAGCIIALLFGVAVTSVVFIYNRQILKESEKEKREKQENIRKKACNPDEEKEKLEFEELCAEETEDDKTTLLKPGPGTADTAWLSGNDQGKAVCFSIDRNPYIVGKKGDRVNGVLKNSSVSRIHASISRTNGRYFLSDMNSTNGTFINGRRLEINETVALEDGDRVGFAGTVLLFRNQSSCPAC